jgi:hypothetical protein
MKNEFEREFDKRMAQAWAALEGRFSPELESPDGDYEHMMLVENLSEAQAQVHGVLDLLVTPDTFAMTPNGAQVERSLQAVLKILSHLVQTSGNRQSQYIKNNLT